MDELSQGSKSEPTVCPSCHQKNNPRFARCWKCGTVISSDLPVETLINPPSKKAKPQTPESVFWYLFTIGMIAFLAKPLLNGSMNWLDIAGTFLVVGSGSGIIYFVMKLFSRKIK